MRESHICPKCTSADVVPIVKDNPYTSLPIGLLRAVLLERWVCLSCGFVESYVKDLDKLNELRNRYGRLLSESEASGQLSVVDPDDKSGGLGLSDRLGVEEADS